MQTFIYLDNDDRVMSNHYRRVWKRQISSETCGKHLRIAERSFKSLSVMITIVLGQL